MDQYYYNTQTDLYEAPFSPYSPNASIISTLEDCEATCEHMTNYLYEQHDVQSRSKQLQLLRDCADACSTTSKYIARNSVHAPKMAETCARVCESCGRECLRFPDPMSQQCGRICLNCAKECRDYVRQNTPHR